MTFIEELSLAVLAFIVVIGLVALTVWSIWRNTDVTKTREQQEDYQSEYPDSEEGGKR